MEFSLIRIHEIGDYNKNNFLQMVREVDLQSDEFSHALFIRDLTWEYVHL